MLWIFLEGQRAALCSELKCRGLLNAFAAAFSSSSPNNDITIIATGSEVSLAVNVAVRIRGDGIIAKVISMPSSSVFEKL